MSILSIDGRSIAYDITGNGAVSVILETGIGADSAQWSPVAGALAEHARVLTYDRAGRGSSDPADGVRSIADMRADLAALIDANGLRSPFVLVGHSFGGVLARAIAREREMDLCGIVLAESMHPRQFDCLGPLFPPADDADARSLVEMREFWQAAWKRPDSTPEHIDLPLALSDDAIARGSLDGLPVRVLSAASFAAMPFIADENVRHALQSQWDALQQELHALSDATEAVYLEQSGHFVQRDQPDAIVRAVLDLIASR